MDEHCRDEEPNEDDHFTELDERMEDVPLGLMQVVPMDAFSYFDMSEVEQRDFLVKMHASYFPEVLFVDRELALSLAETKTFDEKCRMFIIEDIVGRNPTTVAFVARRISDNDRVVAKITKFETDQHAEHARNEAECQSRVNHFGVVRCHGHWESEGRMLLVMEFCGGGDLDRQIRRRSKDGQPMQDHEVGLLLFQLTLALHHMHQHRMLHRDIKGANVFLLANGLAKLGDFGLTKQFADDISAETAESFCGTVHYIAPEMWQRMPYSRKADMWSLGILLYETLTVMKPFRGTGRSEIMGNIMSGNYDALPRSTAPELKQIVAKLLNVDPNKRPTTSELLDMNYLRFVSVAFIDVVLASTTIPHEEKTIVLAQVMAARRHFVRSVWTAEQTAAAQGTRRGGVLKLGTDRRWKRRYLCASPTELRIGLSSDMTNTSKQQIVNWRTIRDVLLVPQSFSRGSPNQLMLMCPKEAKLQFRCMNPSERDKWLCYIEERLFANRTGSPVMANAGDPLGLRSEVNW